MKKEPKNPTVRLRRNFRKSGLTGSWKLRIAIDRGKNMKVYPLEVGLGTRDEEEARRRAEVVVHAFEAAGLHAEHPFRVDSHNLARRNNLDHNQGLQLTLF